jgi:hypothetical protein
MIMDTRFNVGLFRMLVLPNVRMLGEIYRIATATKQEKIVRRVNRHFRTFCLLPWTCPNELVELLIGRVDDHLRSLALAVDHKLICRRTGNTPDKLYLKSIKVTV